MKHIHRAFFSVPVAAALLACGCAGDEGPVLEVGSRSHDAAPENETYLVPDVELAQTGLPAEHRAPKERSDPGLASKNEESWPPEIVVGVSDTLVSPGQFVQLAARATPDVTEMALWDGLGEKEPFHYDSNERLWKATYRAPLESRWERIGLSVTAKNAGERWRRVWVFVRLGSESPRVEPSAPEAAPDPEPARIGEANEGPDRPPLEVQPPDAPESVRDGR